MIPTSVPPGRRSQPSIDGKREQVGEGRQPRCEPNLRFSIRRASQFCCGMEASMTDVAAPSSWYLEFQIPSILRRWDGRVRPTPVRVPELALTPGPRQRNNSSGFDGEWVDPSSANNAESLRVELFNLENQVPRLRQERDELGVELADLNDQIPTLRRERDELLATAVPLSAEVAALQSKQEELISLRSEIQALRLRKSSLERSLAELRLPSEMSRRGWTDHQKFHDS